MEPTPPFWFRQRQCQIESVAPDTYRLTGPNLPEAFISVQRTEAGRWRPVLRLKQDGPDVDAPAVDLENPKDAWEAAFELYRERLVV